MSEFKVGDVCIIKGRPTKWSSFLNENSPMNNLNFPKKITITKIFNRISYTSMTCGYYGWDLDSLIKDGLIEKHPDNNKKYKSKKFKINGF